MLICLSDFILHYNKPHHFLETVHLKEAINKVEFIVYKIDGFDKYNGQLSHLIMKCLEGNKTHKKSKLSVCN